MERFSELARLFFETRQIIRDHVPEGVRDPNAWMRSEALRFIADAKEPGMKDLAAYLRVRAPSATSLVIHLEREGLVTRATCRDDRRIVRIMLTQKGTRTVRAYEKRSADIMHRVFGKLSDRELEDFTAALRRLSSLHSPAVSGIMHPHERSRSARRKDKEA
jgi:DNA-binding MarR family transcriptional regulator